MKFSFLLSLMMITVSLFGEQTLAIIKPDAVQAKNIGSIIHRYEDTGFTIDQLKMVRLSKQQAEEFYHVHKGKPFFEDLTSFMSSGPIVAIVLDGDNAIAKNRELMGATDLKNAKPGTLRKDFATSLTKNAVHGSDSKESAQEEIQFFFGH